MRPPARKSCDEIEISATRRPPSLPPAWLQSQLRTTSKTTKKAHHGSRKQKDVAEAARSEEPWSSEIEGSTIFTKLKDFDPTRTETYLVALLYLTTKYVRTPSRVAVVLLTPLCTCTATDDSIGGPSISWAEKIAVLRNLAAQLCFSFISDDIHVNFVPTCKRAVLK